MKMQNSFLVWGITQEPVVCLLSPNERTFLDSRLRIASKHGKDELRHDAYKQAFRVDAQWAVPCWSDDAMSTLAEQYRGYYEERVRGLAACIVTGTPYGYDDDATYENDSEGGQRANLDPPKPQPQQPGGAAVALMFGNAA